MGIPHTKQKRTTRAVAIFVGNLRLQGYSADVVRMDEDGSLARSTEFMKTCIEELKLIIQTTGGYNSENNGMVEYPSSQSNNASEHS